MFKDNTFIFCDYKSKEKMFRLETILGCRLKSKHDQIFFYKNYQKKLVAQKCIKKYLKVYIFLLKKVMVILRSIL